MVRGRTNIREIAAAAGVSTASVSRVLQDPPARNVSASLRNRVLRICSEMHYVPNAHTRRMFAHRADTVAILFPSHEAISSDSHGQVVDRNLINCMMGAQKYLASKGIGLLLNELNDEYLRRKEYLRLVRSMAVDGILVWGVWDRQDWISEILKESIPVVMLQTYLEGCSCPHVIADDLSGMTSLVEQVLAAGHTHIGYAPAPESASTGHLRNEAVRRGLACHGCEPAIEYEGHGYGFEFGYEAGKALLERDSSITCIVNANDMAAWGCMKAARDLGLKVPEELSVVGCDGLSFPFDTILNSYYLPAMEIGCKGAELLLELIAGRKVPEETILPVQTLQGNTLKPCALTP